MRSASLATAQQTTQTTSLLTVIILCGPQLQRHRLKTSTTEISLVAGKKMLRIVSEICFSIQGSRMLNSAIAEIRRQILFAVTQMY